MVVDAAAGAWGHILVDDVVVPRAAEGAADDHPVLPADEDDEASKKGDPWGPDGPAP